MKTLFTIIILSLLACGDNTKEAVWTSSPIEYKKCTTWKGLCIGDTVFYKIESLAIETDTTTCVITKIVFRYNTVGDLIGAKTLDGRYLRADESWFNERMSP